MFFFCEMRLSKEKIKSKTKSLSIIDMCWCSFPLKTKKKLIKQQVSSFIIQFYTFFTHIKIITLRVYQTFL